VKFIASRVFLDAAQSGESPSKPNATPLLASPRPNRGIFVFIPRGTPHTWQNVGTEPLRFFDVVGPPLAESDPL
jgi:oxalate decarboxylase/phosphoglucose isomerase-like protein (cupin superfamily)